ncbi:hypothetical protein [Leptospira levettii]|nr:hypothetical protein [Leptospira levettii]
MSLKIFLKKTGQIELNYQNGSTMILDPKPDRSLNRQNEPQ